ncbi:MAG: ribbon-helix-helix protein, CopG family [Thiohalocapsa sp. PB-PSB1]|jgi:Arc/MetJ-type ribon-helix-helix transcriptional regulator|nr:MAG: hypothetical protein N838_31840 [Thiohalocapsa sp. PB-PSB1]QQO54303.1 MAG: ribbon-helix-helix protein, CopG family [Thiohalocapsa sp. PB-PSB1]
MPSASFVVTNGLQPTQHRQATKKAVKKTKAMESLIVKLSPETLAIVDEMVKTTGSHTRSEFVRNLFRFAAATHAELKEGNRPLWQDKDGNLYRSRIHEFLFQQPID